MSIWHSMGGTPTLGRCELDVAITYGMHPSAGYAVRLASIGTNDVHAELDLDQVRRLRDILSEQIGNLERHERTGP